MAGGLFPTHDLHSPLPRPAAACVYPGTALASVPVVPGDATACLSVWGLPPNSRHWERRGRRPKQFVGIPVSQREASPASWAARPPVVPRPPALNSSSYWPKVSAPSGKLTSHWPAPDHMTPLLSGSGNLGRPHQVQLKAEVELGQVMPAGRGPRSAGHGGWRSARRNS